MNLKPLGDRLVIEPVEQEEQTASGIFLPETAKEKPQQGKVVAAGPGSRKESGERIDLLLGLNYAVGMDAEGHGHRFSIEGGLPIYQNLRGPQLRSDWRIGGAWQWTF